MKIEFKADKDPELWLILPTVAIIMEVSEETRNIAIGCGFLCFSCCIEIELKRTNK